MHEDSSEHRAASEPRVNEDRFRGLVEASLQGIFVHHDFVPLFANQALADILGYLSPDEVLALGTLERIFAAEELARLREYAAARLAGTAAPGVYEAAAMHKDGSAIVLQVGASVVSWEGRQAILGTVIDLTERKRYEQRLRESEQLLRTVISNSPVILWSIDPDGIVQLADGKGLAAQNLRPEQVLGRSIFEIYRDHPDFLANVRRALGGEAFNAVNETQGAVYDRWFQPVHNQQGELTRVIGVSVNITERARAERAIRENQRLLRSVVDTLPHLVFFKDRDLRYQMVNRTFAEHHGVSIADLIGMHSKELPRRTAENRKRFAADDKVILQTGEPVYNSDIRVTAPDGKEIIYDAIKMPLKDESGEITGIVGIVEDVTDIRRYQVELEEYRQHLEELVETRTAELVSAQQELVIKARLAAIGQLTATVSHELRNPLGTIQTTIELLRAQIDATNPAISRSMERIDRSIVRCVKIIDELLVYTRGRKLEMALTEIDEWLRAFTDELDVPDGVGLRLDLQSDASMQVDPERLRQAVLNLANNAFQSVQEEGTVTTHPQVTLSSRTSSGRLEILVSDAGPGMSHEICEQIFEPLFSTRAFGVGLGLPLVKQIAKQHGGDVECESEPGQGAVFKLWIPIDPR